MTTTFASKKPVLCGVVFDMDGTITKPNLDFKLMYERSFCFVKCFEVDDDFQFLLMKHDRQRKKQRKKFNFINEIYSSFFGY